jgi:hypothetical protein
MFQVGFMGSSFTTLHNLVYTILLNVKTYPNHFRSQNMHQCTQSQAPGQVLCNATRCMQLEIPITPCTLVGFE